MKIFLLFIFSIFIISCSDKDATIEFLEEGIKSGTELCYDHNQYYYNILEAHSLENPEEMKPYRTISKKLYQIKKELIYDISLFQNDSLLKIRKEKNPKIDSIKNKLIVFKSHVTEILKEKDSILLIINQLNIEQANNMELLKNKVTLFENYALKRLIEQTTPPQFHVNKIKIAVVPKRNQLFKNETYEAEIYFLPADTTSFITVVIDEKQLDVNNGTAIYIDNATYRVGNVTKSGNLRLQEPGSDFYRDFPFSFSYKILK